MNPELLILIRIKCECFQSWFTSFFVLAAYLSKLCLSDNITIEFCQSVPLLKNAFKISFVLLSIFVHLRIDDYITWTWSAIFWPLWINFGITSMISIVICFLTCMTGCDYINGKATSFDFVAALWMLFVFIGYSFSVIIFGHSVLSHLQNNKEALLNAFTVPLLYFPILVIASILLYSRLTTQIANAEEERRAKNPKYKAEEALNLLHQGLPTGYPQTPTRPNFL